MARPVISRSIKRGRVREMQQDASEAGHVCPPSSAFFSAAGRALAMAPDRKNRRSSVEKPREKSRKKRRSKFPF